MPGRHRSPPPTKPPDYTIPLGIAAGVLTAASLVAIAATAVAPDASAAARDGVTVSTASRSARTVHVPLTIQPAPLPSIGAEGAWDPETDIALSRPVPSETFAGATGTATTPTALSGESVAITAPPSEPTGSTPEPTEPTSPASTTEAAASSAPTEESPMPTETATPTDDTDVAEITATVTAEVGP